MERKVFTVHMDKVGINVLILSDAFDALLDQGYDDILIITPHKRYIASIDEWLDFSHLDVSGDVEVRVLGKSYMGVV